MSREDVRNFLIGQKDNSKEDVLKNFTSLAIAEGRSVDQLGKMIRDLRSYKEWSWGE
jgi:hypothetical protein